MTVSSSTRRADYTGNGVTTSFTVPFYFLDSSHLTVLLTVIATGVESTLVLNTDYTVSGAGVSSGGSITTTTAYSSSYRITILRNVPLTQETHYLEGDPFPAASHEMALDRLTMQNQQIQEQVDRSFKLREGSVSEAGEFPDPESGSGLVWDGVDLVNVPITGSGGAASIGYSPGYGYSLGSVGYALDGKVDTYILKETSDPSTGAGFIPYSNTQIYDENTVGSEIHNLWALTPEIFWVVPSKDAGSGSPGISTAPAKTDHVHPVNVGSSTPSSVSLDKPAAGSSGVYARADHAHAVNPSNFTGIGSGVSTFAICVNGSRGRLWKSDWQGQQLMYPTARTNLVTYSQTMDIWSAVNITRTADSVAAPDGTTTAETLNEGTATGIRYISNDSPGTKTGIYTISVYVKAGTQNKCQLEFAGGGLGYTSFDLAAGTITANPSGGHASITPVGNGWFRLAVAMTYNAQICKVVLFTGDTYANSYTGTSRYLYAWGAQVEEGDTATSYIPTTTAAVTRTDYTLSTSGLVNLLYPLNSGESVYWSDKNSGKVTLVAGTATVSNALVTANSLIHLTRLVTGGTVGHLSVGAITPGVSFVINSTSGSETSTVCYQISEP